MINNEYSKGIIDKNTKDCLIPDSPKIACFYLLPKLHKNMQTPPGHPIVSGNESLCEGICKYIDLHLKPIVELLPSFARDTDDVIRKVENIFLKPACALWLWTLRLYIPQFSIKIAFFPQESFWWWIPFQWRKSNSLLEFALSHNFFIFKESLNLQLQGIAMGASSAPSYADLFLGLWESDIFLTCPVRHHEKVLLWIRYIDDVLLIFVEVLNINSKNIKLTLNYSQEKVEFLDVILFKDTAGYI